MKIAIITLCYSDKYLMRTLEWRRKLNIQRVNAHFYVYVDNEFGEKFSTESANILISHGFNIIGGDFNRGTLLARYNAILSLHEDYDYVLMHDDDDLLTTDAISHLATVSPVFDVINFDFLRVKDKEEFPKFYLSDTIDWTLGKGEQLPNPFASDAAFRYDIVTDYSNWMLKHGIKILKSEFSTDRILSNEDEIFCSLYSAYIHLIKDRSVARMTTKKIITIADETNARSGKYEEEVGLYANNIDTEFPDKLQRVYEKIINIWNDLSY